MSFFRKQHEQRLAYCGCKQVTLELGGSDDQPILIYNMRCFADTLAMLVADAKGRINFATSQLAAMLGYSVNTLTEGMNISMMMQPPYSQLHTAYFKVGVLIGPKGPRYGVLLAERAKPLAVVYPCMHSQSVDLMCRLFGKLSAVFT